MTQVGGFHARTVRHAVLTGAADSVNAGNLISDKSVGTSIRQVGVVQFEVNQNMHIESFRMPQGPFPKPPPAKPLPEDQWLWQTDRAEVGREPFFNGREAEYEVFRRAALLLHQGYTGGGTMIFQGAPGAGKTALMLECAEAVRRHSTPQDPWVAVLASPRILNLPESLMMAMVNATHQESERLSAMASQSKASGLHDLRELGRTLLAELLERGFSVPGISVGGKPQEDGGSNPDLAADTAFQKMAPLLREFRVVVLVDEAQNVPVDDMSINIVDCLHRDTQGIPLVAAFFGLSDTVDVLRECGLSRPARGRVVNLDPLPLTDAKAAIRKMLDAYYAGSEQIKDDWATGLAELSQGWPQHVNVAGVAVGLTLAESGTKTLEDRPLEQALEKANELKNIYYEQRVAAGYPRDTLYIKLALAAARNASGALNIDELSSLLAAELENTGTSFGDFLRQSLHAGLLAPMKGVPKQYKFPIPSLGDYLRSAAPGVVNPD